MDFVLAALAALGFLALLPFALFCGVTLVIFIAAALSKGSK